MKQGEKKNIVDRLVDVPTKGKRPFWAREMTLLNRLLKRWPQLDFWKKVNLGEKAPSLAYFLTDIGVDRITRKYNEFNFEIPPPKAYPLGSKIGEDTPITHSCKTVSQFFKK